MSVTRALVLLVLGVVQLRAQPSTVILVRHAERAAEPARDPVLTDAGAQRARDLGAALSSAGVGTIITTQFQRTQLTAAPLGTLIGKAPVIVSAGADARAHVDSVAAAVRRASGVVLVVGHSNTIPAIIGALGGPKLPDLCDNQYSRLFVLELGSGAAHLIQASYGASDPPGSDGCTRTMGPEGAAPPMAVRAGSWRSEPPMRFARAAHAVVSTADAIFAMAGTGIGGAPVLEVERFDGREWTVVSRLPGSGLNAPAAAVLNGKIYLIGGFNTTTNVPTDKVLVFDPSRKSWSEAAPLPAPRGGHAAIAFGGRIHVIGGGNSQRTLDDHSVYDPATNSWSAAAPLPRSEGSPAAVVFAGKLYSIGGRSGPGDFGNVDVYDPAANAWAVAPAIEPRGTSGAALYCGRVHVFGGESQARAMSLGDALRLSTDARVWESLPPLPTPRNFARAVVFRDAVFVVGGSPTPGRSHASEGSAIVESYRDRC